MQDAGTTLNFRRNYYGFEKKTSKGGRTKEFIMPQTKFGRYQMLKTVEDKDGNVVKIKKPGKSLILIRGEKPVESLIVPFWFFDILSYRNQFSKNNFK